MKDIIIANLYERAKKFIEEIKNKSAAFLIISASTLTSTIKGISIAGENPELTLYTPAADVEYLLLGKCLSINTIPKTPEGIPTPAIITRVCKKILNIPCFVINAGCYIKPKVSNLDLDGKYGENIRKGNALDLNISKRIYENAKIFINEILDVFDVFIIGETIPGGTTTTMAFLAALGYEHYDKVSSANRENPKELKIKIVNEALKNANIHEGMDVLEIASKVSDPFIIAASSISEEIVRKNKYLILAGGTQMASIIAFLKEFKVPNRNIIIGTTRWILEDNSSDIISMINEINPTPIIASNISFKNSKHLGLRKYEEGYVKEGVGAGGISCYSYIKGISFEKIEEEVEKEYERIFL